MELIKGIPLQTFTRSPYVKPNMGGPGGPEGEGPGGPGGPNGAPVEAQRSGFGGEKDEQGSERGFQPEAGNEEERTLRGRDMPQERPTSAALEIQNGRIVNQSDRLNGQITAASAKDIVLDLNSPDMGGVYVSGEGSDFVLEHANIRISGEGQGLGGKLSGAAVEDHATLTLKDCRINMDGRLRCATSAGGNSVLKVYDSLLACHGAAWNIEEKEVTWVMGPGMSKPPVYLEIEGNMRTHCTVMDSESYFYNSTIIADSWAALSTDAAGDRVYLEANDCKVITTRSGYGTYADTGCYVALNRCDLDVQNMAAIVAGESGVQLNDCVGKCGSYVVMNHVVGGGPVADALLCQVSDIAIRGGKFRCGDAAVVVKSNNADILLEGAEIFSHIGVLVKSRINDDPCAPDPQGKEVYGIHVTLRNLDTANSILHEDPNRRMTVRFEASRLIGAITGGALISLDEGSHWTATADSTVVFNGDVALSQLDALPGVTITARGGEAKTAALPSGGSLVVTA